MGAAAGLGPATAEEEEADPGAAEAHLTAPCPATERTPGTAAGTRRETRRTSAGAGAGLKKLRGEAEATKTHACNQHVPLVLMFTNVYYMYCTIRVVPIF